MNSHSVTLRVETSCLPCVLLAKETSQSARNYVSQAKTWSTRLEVNSSCILITVTVAKKLNAKLSSVSNFTTREISFWRQLKSFWFCKSFFLRESSIHLTNPWCSQEVPFSASNSCGLPRSHMTFTSTSQDVGDLKLMGKRCMDR